MARLVQKCSDASENGASCKSPPLLLPTAGSTSPSRRLRSPTKSPAKRTNTASEGTVSVRARQQRSLKLEQVDSLLLHPVAEGTERRPGGVEAKCRSSPARKAKARASLSYNDSGLEATGDDVAASDWQGSQDSSGDDETSDDERVWYSPTKHASDARHLKLPTPPIFRRPLGSLQLESPRRNAPHVFGRPPNHNTQTFTRDRPSSSSDGEPLATIRFSPPTSKKPSKRPTVEPRARTPSPPRSPSKSKLVSPTKKKAVIPPTPHPPSIDAFWNPEVVNAWNEEYSPRKTLKSPRKTLLADSSDDSDSYTPTISPRKTSPQKHSPTKRDKTKIAAKKQFEASKHAIATTFLSELETKIARGQISAMTQATGGITLIWSKKLNSTAGRANWKREGTKIRDENGDITTSYKHIASIELAEKVIDDEHRLLNVLAHEYCHLLNFMVSNVRNQPHGASFKAWAKKVTDVFGDRGIEVTTKHSYEIEYKYLWVCQDDLCATEYERHSRSIDPARHTCGKCRGRLVQVRPAPRGGGKADGEKKESEYQKFVKSQFGEVKREIEEKEGQKSPMKDVMREVAVRYRAMRHGSSVKGDSKEVGKGENEVEVVEVTDDEVAADDVLDAVSRKLDFLTIKD